MCVAIMTSYNIENELYLLGDYRNLSEDFSFVYFFALASKLLYNRNSENRGDLFLI